MTALAVAADAVAVSITAGMSHGKATWAEALRMATVFGVFQAVMPALGYLGGAYFRSAIEAYDHWVAFALLAAVGVHMIMESRGSDSADRAGNPFEFTRLLLLGLATSVDAAAVGLSFALTGIPLLLAASVIGLTTFVLCVPAVRMGARLGVKLAHRAELLGGLVLIAIGARTLIEHLSGAA